MENDKQQSWCCSFFAQLQRKWLDAPLSAKFKSQSMVLKYTMIGNDIILFLTYKQEKLSLYWYSQWNIMYVHTLCINTVHQVVVERL